MCFLSKYLRVKTSTLPGAGKGLFTTTEIKKGEIIIEYLGKRYTWKEVEDDTDNGYIYFIDNKNVIDASQDKKALGRYANDASGLQKIKGISNNTEYVQEDKRVFLRAKKLIPAGSEIFVSYGPEYWKQVRTNMKIDAQKKKKKPDKTAS